MAPPRTASASVAHTQTTALTFLHLAASFKSSPSRSIKMNWNDPLRHLEIRTPHPAPRSEASSELSSCLEDSDRFLDHHRIVGEKLRDYVPRDANDDTAQVLRAFLGKLPKAGQLALMAEIYHLSDDPSQLRQLRNFLVDAILIPSTSPSNFLIL